MTCKRGGKEMKQNFALCWDCRENCKKCEKCNNPILDDKYDLCWKCNNTGRCKKCNKPVNQKYTSCFTCSRPATASLP